MFSDIFDHKLTDTEEGGVKQFGLWRLAKAIKVIEKFDKVYSQYLREF